MIKHLNQHINLSTNNELTFLFYYISVINPKEMSRNLSDIFTQNRTEKNGPSSSGNLSSEEENDLGSIQEIDNNSQLLNTPKLQITNIPSTSFGNIKEAHKRPNQEFNDESPLKKKIYKSDINSMDPNVLKYYKEKRCSEDENSKKQFLLSLLPDINEMNRTQYRMFRSQVNKLINSILCTYNTTQDTIGSNHVNSS